MNRRSFLFTSAAVILTPGLLMPVRKIWTPESDVMTATEILRRRAEVEVWFREAERRLMQAWAADLTMMLTPPARPWFTLSLSAQAEKDLLLGLPARLPGTP